MGLKQIAGDLDRTVVQSVEEVHVQTALASLLTISCKKILVPIHDLQPEIGSIYAGIRS